MKKVSKFVLILIVSFVFLDFVSAETYNNYESDLVSCGSGLLTGIPAAFPSIISIVYTIIQVIVPILLVVFGSIDLVKGIVASKEDEIKKGQQILIKRVITAVIIFFVFTVVKFLISLVADRNDILECSECFIRNNDKCVVEIIS